MLPFFGPNANFGPAYLFSCHAQIHVLRKMKWSDLQYTVGFNPD